MKKKARDNQHLSVYYEEQREARKGVRSFEKQPGASAELPHLFLERADEVEVVVRDVVVVVLDLRERFLVRLHEPLDMGVLSLFDPGRFCFSRRVQPLPHLGMQAWRPTGVHKVDGGGAGRWVEGCRDSASICVA